MASPLGFTAAGRHWYADVYLPALGQVVTPVDPWTLTDPREIEAAAEAGRERELWLAVGARNADAIRSSELLVALLDGQELDSGTAAEVGYGAALGLRCFGLRTDLRDHGEPGVHVNLQVEHFIVASGGVVATTLEELVAVLR